MPTKIHYDLRGAPPYYAITKDQDRTIRSTPGGVMPSIGGYGNSISSYRSGIFSDLDRERQWIFGRIRNDNAGPVTIPARASLDLTRVDYWSGRVTAARTVAERDAALYMQRIEYQFALDMQEAQQIVQDAVRAGADWILGDWRYQQAKMARGRLVAAAMDRYNAALPRGGNHPRKIYSLWWGA